METWLIILIWYIACSYVVIITLLLITRELFSSESFPIIILSPAVVTVGAVIAIIGVIKTYKPLPVNKKQ